MVEAALQGRDVFVLMPTGGSLCVLIVVLMMGGWMDGVPCACALSPLW